MAVSRFDGALGKADTGPTAAIAPIGNLSASLMGLTLIGGEKADILSA